MLGILFSPLSYLRVKHPSKWRVDWGYPALLTALTVLVIGLWSKPGAIVGASGLLDKLALVCSILPGFYIAALAAIATFNRPDIDDAMPAPTPTLVIDIGGRENVINLTRRRFLAYLFAFLCWESLALLIVCVFTGIIADGVIKDLPAILHPSVKYIFLSCLMLLFWQLIAATCLGLYYLGDRLNRPAY